MAHNNIEQLQFLVSALDAPFNDIYVHFDKSSKEAGALKSLKTQYSELKIFCEFNVHWGSYSIVETEMFLFKQASQTRHSYYHLLSGSDFPIKPLKSIYDFFEANHKEFVLFSHEKMQKADYRRIDYKHICVEKFRTRKYKLENRMIDLIDDIGVFAQKVLRIRQKRVYPSYQKGSQWVSLTEDFVKYLLTQEDKIRAAFCAAFVPDEMFVQTVLINSSYQNQIYNTHEYNQPIQNMRLIDWKRGKPYTFTLSDLEDLLNSECMFARKFDAKLDSRILLELNKQIHR